MISITKLIVITSYLYRIITTIWFHQRLITSHERPRFRNFDFGIGGPASPMKLLLLIILGAIQVISIGYMPYSEMKSAIDVIPYTASQRAQVASALKNMFAVLSFK